MSFLLRITSYILSWLTYLVFMSINAPLGVTWLPWHLNRLSNSVGYLDENGFFLHYGFSIWSKCEDCVLTTSEWGDQIYSSVNGLSLFPYWIINSLGGKDALLLFGPLLDKLIILLTGALAAELLIKYTNKLSTLPGYFIALSFFILFITSPWVYKMLISSWFEIYFLFFLLLGLFSFTKNYISLGFFFLFISGIFHPLCALSFLGFYILTLVMPVFTKEENITNSYLPPNITTFNQKLSLLFSLFFPVLIFFILRAFLQSDMPQLSGSSLLTRIGISGNDVHNGGLLGALQFLGGNRITTCLANYSSDLFSSELDNKIMVYNCFLSIGSMLAVSLLSILGLLIFIYRSPEARWLIAPLGFSFLLFIAVFQQSLSVHLMGYSYIFGLLFATGLCALIMNLSRYINSINLSIVFSIPLILGITILSVRISMLTGLNG